MSLDDFIKKALSVPFKAEGRDYDGWDCYGLCRCAYRDVYECLLPEYTGYSYKSEYQALRQALSAEKTLFDEVKEPRAGDIALFDVKSKRLHVALVINERDALHSNGKSGTFIEPLNSAYWSKRLDGLYRLKK